MVGGSNNYLVCKVVFIGMTFIYSEWEANKVVDLFIRVLLDFFSVGAKKIQLKVCDLHLMHMHIFDI